MHHSFETGHTDPTRPPTYWAACPEGPHGEGVRPNTSMPSRAHPPTHLHRGVNRHRAGREAVAGQCGEVGWCGVVQHLGMISRKVQAGQLAQPRELQELLLRPHIKAARAAAVQVQRCEL